jgi:hypothetical protein
VWAQKDIRDAGVSCLRGVREMPNERDEEGGPGLARSTRDQQLEQPGVSDLAGHADEECRIGERVVASLSL